MLGGWPGYTRQMAFSAGLKGVAVTDTDRVELLILATLEALAQGRFRRHDRRVGQYHRVCAAREQHRPLSARAGAAGAGAGHVAPRPRPAGPAGFEAPLATVKARLEPSLAICAGNHPPVFARQPHRVGVILEPDAELNQRLEEAE